VLAKARLDAQLTRSNAEQSVERMLMEPRSESGLGASTALGVLAAIRTFALAGLTLDATRPDSACPPWPALRPLAERIEQSLAAVATGLRSGRAAAPASGLRALHADLAETVDGEALASGDASDCPPLRRVGLAETDLMVDSVVTIDSLVRSAMAAPRGRPNASLTTDIGNSSCVR
jgi:hypothetical protein